MKPGDMVYYNDRDSKYFAIIKKINNLNAIVGSYIFMDLADAVLSRKEARIAVDRLIPMALASDNLKKYFVTELFKKGIKEWVV